MTKENIAENILARADHVLYFLEHILIYKNMKANDLAWQRSILIMLSYSFELILKAEVCFSSTKKEANKIDKELKDLGHNIQNILIYLDNIKHLSAMNITSYNIIQNGGLKQYKIMLNSERELLVEDFVDIRYDYTKQTLRNLQSHDTIVNYIKDMLDLSKNISTRKGLITTT